jgi:hypothetical protein
VHRLWTRKPSLMRLWNPTLAQRTRKNGAPGNLGLLMKLFLRTRFD